MPSPNAHLSRSLTVLAALSAALTFAACGPIGAGGTPKGNSPQTTGSTPPTTAASTTTTVAPVQAVDGKVTILEVGDSLGIDLGWGMQWALTNDSSVNLVQDAWGDSGLVNTVFYDWPETLESELQSVHPQIVVVFLGANDSQSFYVGNQYESFGTPHWKLAYGDRVASMMTEATSAGARVVWVGMPIMEPTELSSNMTVLDSVFQSEAASHSGVTYFSSWDLFETDSGQFNGGTTDVSGSELPLRDGDGIHLATGGEDLLGVAVVHEMEVIYKLG
jgi:hypothetical protein